MQGRIIAQTRGSADLFAGTDGPHRRSRHIRQRAQPVAAGRDPQQPCAEDGHGRLSATEMIGTVGQHRRARGVRIESLVDHRCARHGIGIAHHNKDAPASVWLIQSMEHIGHVEHATVPEHAAFALRTIHAGNLGDPQRRSMADRRLGHETGVVGSHGEVANRVPKGIILAEWRQELLARTLIALRIARRDRVQRPALPLRHGDSAPTARHCAADRIIQCIAQVACAEHLHAQLPRPVHQPRQQSWLVAVIGGIDHAGGIGAAFEGGANRRISLLIDHHDVLAVRNGLTCIERRGFRHASGAGDDIQR